MAELDALATGAARVRSPDAERLAELLAQEGVRARVGDGVLMVDAPTERIGELAAAQGIVLHELTSERASLEEVFLELTGEPGERGA